MPASQEKTNIFPEDESTIDALVIEAHMSDDAGLSFTFPAMRFKSGEHEFF